MKERLLHFLIPRVASLFIRLLHLSARVRHLNLSNITGLNEAGQQYLIAFWHCHLLLMVYSRHRKPITVMISQHKDGEYIAQTMRRFGVDSSRGSTTRGGTAALRDMVELSEKGWNIAITPDGPRGPARVAQAGVVLAARRTGVPVMPIAVISEKKWQLRSWDSFEIPHPFSRVLFVYGEPMVIPPGREEGGVEEWRQRVEQTMRSICDDTEARFDELWRQAAS